LGLLALLAMLASTLLPTGNSATTAFAHAPGSGEKTISQTNPPNAVPVTGEIEWHWVLKREDNNGVTMAPPAHIHVTWANEPLSATNPELVPWTDGNNAVAHYRTTSHNGAATVVPSGVTVVVPSWYPVANGSFVLSHSPGNVPTPTPTNTPVPLTPTPTPPPAPAANITIASSATNEVGKAHKFTITVTGVPGVVSAAITPAVSPAPGTQSDTCATPIYSGGNTATCTVTINSTTPGVFTATASASVVTGNGTVNVSTDGLGNNSGAAVKTYVDASIAIAHAIAQTATNEVGQSHTFAIGQTATNEVGQSHTFTVTVTGSGDLSNVSITPSVSPAPGTLSDTCANPSVSGNTATCTITINSTVPGVFTANASANVTIAGLAITRSTSGNAGPAGSGAAVKTYVDASISIAPTATNEVGQAHTFTVTVTGSGDLSNVSITPSVNLASTPCDTGTLSVSGNTATCTVTINSAVAGTFTANASANVTIAGLAITRSTAGNAGPAGSGAAVKKYVDASIRIGDSATNDVGAPHTFTVAVTANPEGFTPSYGMATVTVNPAPMTGGTYTCRPVATPNPNLATCTVTINSDVTGVFTATASADVTMDTVTVTRTTDGTGANSGPAIKTYECLTVTKVFTVTGAGKSQTAHDAFVSGALTVSVAWKLNGVTQSPIALTLTNPGATFSPAGALVFVGQAPFRIAGTINAWSVLINGTNPAVNFNSGDLTLGLGEALAPDSTEPNKSHCVMTNTFQSPLSKVTFTKAEDVNGDGLISQGEQILNSLGGWTITAVSGSESPSCVTDSFNGACSLELDGILAWTISETAQSGWAQVYPASGSISRPSGSTVDTYVFGNAQPSAAISLSPLTAVNEVGGQHRVTAVVTQKVASGATPAPALDGTVVTFSLTNSLGATAAFVGGNTCSTVGGTCSIVINSNTAGAVNIGASATVAVGGSLYVGGAVNIPVTATAVHKTYVNASVAIGPATATNRVNDPHTFTVTVTANPADATPVVFTSISVAVTPAPDVQNTNTCATPSVSGNVATCTVTINSSVVGTYTANATAVVTMGGVAVTRDTNPSTATPAGPAGSGPALKSYWCNYCSPGYWKNHTARWDNVAPDLNGPANVVTGWKTTDKFATVMAANGFLPNTGNKSFSITSNTTLLQVLGTSGGDQVALARHLVAAVLNMQAGIQVDGSINTMAELVAVYNQAMTSKDYGTGVTKLTVGSTNEVCPLN